MVKVAPSLLAANFRNLEQEIQAIEKGGADWLHYDVMDGHFVPNISFGYSVLKDIKAITNIYMDVHLMISEPLTYIDAFLDAGADLLVFHIEAMASVEDTISTIQYIKDKHIDVGLSIKPDTPVSQIVPFLSMLDVVLVMSVEPGFGGQTFHESAVMKIQQLVTYRQTNASHYQIEVDGGITEETAAICKAAGADVLVAGSSIFQTADYQQAIAVLK